ncbi:MAG: hypothetical protein ACRD3R_08635 [Terriglobales bacterium]
MKSIRVKVKPGSRSSALEQQADGTWMARIKERRREPTEGRAVGGLI